MINKLNLITVSFSVYLFSGIQLWPSLSRDETSVNNIWKIKRIWNYIDSYQGISYYLVYFDAV